MQAVRLSATKRHEIVDIPAPVTADDQVLVRPEYCGICGSDLHAAEISLFQPGVVIGHEFAGEIVDVGAAVHGWTVGQKVVINPNGNLCGKCSSCRAGRFNQCPVATQERPLGVVRPGGMAELVAMHPSYLNAVPDGLDTRLAAWAEPLAVAVRTVRTSPVTVGDSAVVIGGGPIGQLVVQLLARAGLRSIVLVDASSFRARMGLSSGATEVLQAAEVDERLAAGAIGDADCVFECSGHPSALETAVRLAAPGGTVRLVGMPPSQVTFNAAGAIIKEVQLRTGWIYLPTEFSMAIQLLAGRMVDVDTLTTDVLAIADFEQALAALRSPDSTMKVLIRTSGAPG